MLPNALDEIVITVGYPGSGKSTHVKRLTDRGYQRVNRDLIGGSTRTPDAPIYEEVRRLHGLGFRHFVLDNTYGTQEHRAAVVAVGQELGLPVRVLWLQTTLEQAQLFAARRECAKFGRPLYKHEYKTYGKNDPNCFPPGAQFAYRKRFEEPTLAEGFVVVEKVDVVTTWGPEYTGKAIFLDLDGTVRDTPDPKACPWPRNVSEVLVRPGCGPVLQRYRRDGWLVFAVTNQSGVSRKPTDPKHVSEEDVVACIQRTEGGLAFTFDGYAYSPDRGGPPSSFWRKPCPGMGVKFIEEHKLDPAKCVMVGDMTSDKTFANRCGFAYQDESVFFGVG